MTFKARLAAAAARRGKPGRRGCTACGARDAAAVRRRVHAAAAAATPAAPMDIHLDSVLAAGDAVVLSAAVRDLHRCYPGRFRTAVSTCENNQLLAASPYLTPAADLANPLVLHGRKDDPRDPRPADHPLHFGYPAIQQSTQRPLHFLAGYLECLNQVLGLHVRLTEFRGDIHLTDAERGTRPRAEPYWLLLAGGKADYSAKIWPAHRWQMVVNMLRGRIQFVQAGAAQHGHPPLQHVIDVRGKTTLRQLAQLVYHAEGVACGVTGAMHLAAAFNRPCVVVAGGREPEHWEAYTAANRLATMRHFDPAWEPGADDDMIGHAYLSARPSLPLCGTRACWKSKAADGDAAERCPHLRDERGVLFPECLGQIGPEQVAAAVRRYERRGSGAVESPPSRPRLHFFANMICLGGGEHSSLELMRRLRATHELHFWPLTQIHEGWRVEAFRAADHPHEPGWAAPQIAEGDHVVIYGNDFPNRLAAASGQWREWLRPAASVQLILNYVIGGLWRETWLAANLAAVYFLNTAKEADWAKRVAGGPLADVPTFVLPPPVGLAPFLSIERAEPAASERLVIGRLGGSASKLPPDAADWYRALAKRLPEAAFWFMPRPPGFESLATDPQFVFYERDEMRVPEFLAGVDIFAYPVADHVRDQGPRVIMEAMAAGCCVVAEPRDGARDRIVHGVSGLLAERRDMGPAIVALAGDCAQRAALGAAARERANGWMPAAWIDAIVRHARAPEAPHAAAPPRSGARQFLAHIRGGQGLGNAMAMLPALKALSTLGAVDLWMEPGYHELFRGLGWIRHVVASPDELPQAPADYDAVLPIAYFDGVPGIELNNVPAVSVERWEVNEAEANMARVRALGYEGETPRVRLPDPGRYPGLPDRYAVIGACCRAGDAWARKRWPHFERLARMLPLPCVCIGGAADARDWMDAMAAVTNLCGRTTNTELAQVLAHAEVYVGNDNGPGHLAAAVGAPTVSLFGATSDVKNRPRGGGVHVLRSTHPCQNCQADTKRWNACTDWACLSSLTPEAVAAAVREAGSAWIGRAIADGNRRLLRGDAELLLRACAATRARRILEIGSMDGGSSIILGCWAQRHDAHLWCVDPKPTGRWHDNIARWGLAEAVTMIAAASPWVNGRAPDELDVLFIDGDHRTRWALVDYHYWFPRVRPGGIILFHDWCGQKGVKQWVRRAIDIIMEDDAPRLDEFGRSEGSDRGCIAFIKRKA